MKTDRASATVPSVFDVRLPALPYFDPDYQRDPHGMNRRAMMQGPLALGPLGPEALSYEAVEQVLRDRRFRMPEGLTIEAHGATAGPLQATPSPLSLDGEEHQRLRRLASGLFKPSRVAELQTAMTVVISRLVDVVAGTGWSEVVADIAWPYAIAINSELLEAPNRQDHDELKMLLFAVLAGGTETTSTQLAAAVQVFCDHPAQWALLADRSELAHQAVDEVMRYAPVVLRTLRVAAEDVELAGVMIPAGTLVGANTAAANRDPRIFEEPDRFDILRESPASALPFGGGMHFCLGAHLAKAELAVALAVMARRMPNMDRTGPAPWKSVIGTSGPIALPVAFEPGH